MKRTNTHLIDVIRSPQSVFTTDDLALIWQETKRSLVQDRARYYLKTEQLYQIRKGFYAKDANYNKFEFAIKLYSPAYISLETVLAKEGIINQFYETIFTISYLSREINIDSQNYCFKKIKDTVLSNTLGIEFKENYWVASKERAFLDALYLYKEYHFDNLLGIDWDFCFELVEIYRNKELTKRLKSYYTDYA